MKPAVTLFLLTIPSMLSANIFFGENIDEYFYPSHQAWKVTGVRMDTNTHTQDEFNEVFYNLINSHVYLSKNYFVMKNSRHYEDVVYPACFIKKNQSLNVYMYSEDKIQKLTLKKINDFVVMPFKKDFALKLIKSPVVDKLHANMNIFDERYNKLIKKNEIDTPCKLNSISSLN